MWRSPVPPSILPRTLTNGYFSFPSHRLQERTKVMYETTFDICDDDTLNVAINTAEAKLELGLWNSSKARVPFPADRRGYGLLRAGAHMPVWYPRTSACVPPGPSAHAAELRRFCRCSSPTSTQPMVSISAEPHEDPGTSLMRRWKPAEHQGSGTCVPSHKYQRAGLTVRGGRSRFRVTASVGVEFRSIWVLRIDVGTAYDPLRRLRGVV
ncbi:hypothetical protein C8Q77DRAFT_832398 [Trametes polyzona]|nr:hypothetical protein C8Q77DRAFT_832398 [Trametes polyzona]